MKKSYHAALIGAYILVVLAGVIWHAGGASAEDTIKLTIHSHTTSTASMSNMQPGETMASDYKVINDGNDPFEYSVDFKFLSGDAELYNILHMTLQKEGVIIYSGVMSKAEGRVVVGSLAGGAGEDIQMDVLFPPEAGNEFQGKQVSVAFVFSASEIPGPTPGPTPTVTPAPTTAPTATASATPEITSEPSSVPTATSAPTDSPSGSTAPGATPTASSASAPTPADDGVTVSEAPLPLGGGDSGNGSTGPSATAAAGAAPTGSTPTSSPAPDDGVGLPDDELPLAGPDDGSKLPDTAEPWYNLILASMAVAILSVIVLRKLRSKK